MSSRKRIAVPLSEKKRYAENLNPSIFRRSWINTGLVDEKEFNQEVEQFEDFDVASCLLQKEEEEELIEHFLELQIDENKAAAPVHDQDIEIRSLFC